MAHTLVVIVLAIIGGVGSYLVSVQLPVLQLNHGESTQYIFSLPEKILAIDRTYGYLAYILLPLGVLWLGIKRQLSGWVVPAFTLCLTMAVFTQVPYVWKLFTLLRFFVGVVMAAGLYTLLVKIKSWTVKGVVWVIVVMGLCINLSLNSMYWKDGIVVGSEFRHISDDDIAAAQVLFERYSGVRVLLVSDPATQFVLEGMGGVDTVGGAYMPIAIRQKLVDVLETQNPQYLFYLTSNMTDGVPGAIVRRVVAISGRTFVWLSASPEVRLLFSYNVWSPQVLSDNQKLYLDTLRRSAGFREIYVSPTLHLFEVEAS